MFPQVLDPLPTWFVHGAALGAAISVLVTVVFYAFVRRFPDAGGDDPLSGDSRRRAELRRYLGAIGERFAEDHPVEGETVAFYLPERDVAITFDARAYYRIDRTPTHAVLVEHEMPGAQLGDRLPFETPDLDLGDDARRDATEAAFAVLEVPETATREELKRAYRRKVKEVHPDQGGSQESFHRVREAYTTAKEETGDAGDAGDARARADY